MKTVSNSVSPSRPLDRGTRWALGLTCVAAIVVTLVVGLAARDWIGQTFPGFFLLGNRVVPSIGMPHWTGSRDGTLYQSAVVAIEGRSVASAAEAYRFVASQPVGKALSYKFRTGAASEVITVETQHFSSVDYWGIFGAYLMTGGLYLLCGFIGFALLPGTSAGRALLMVGTLGGVYGLSAVGIYGPTFDLRLHALAEAFLPAAFASLALVFPRERPAITAPATAMAWCLSLALTIPYQLLLYQPGAYSMMHAACETYLGVVGLALTGSLIVEVLRSWSTLFIKAVAFGAMLGVGTPAVVILISGLSGGGLPVNVLAATAFLFPLSVSCGLIGERVALRQRGASGPLEESLQGC